MHRRRMATTYRRLDTLLGKLREHRPDHLVVHVADEDEPTRVNCPNLRNWAQRVMRLLSELRWESIELVDKKGGLLAKHERGPMDEAPANDLESLPMSREVAATGGMLSLMLKAQDLALSRHMAVLGPMFDCLFKILDVSMRRLDLQEKQYEHALKANASLTNDLMRVHSQALVGSVATDDESLSGSMIEPMLPAILRAAMTPDGKRVGREGREPTNDYIQQQKQRARVRAKRAREKATREAANGVSSDPGAPAEPERRAP